MATKKLSSSDDINPPSPAPETQEYEDSSSDSSDRNEEEISEEEEESESEAEKIRIHKTPLIQQQSNVNKQLHNITAHQETTTDSESDSEEEEKEGEEEGEESRNPSNSLVSKVKIKDVVPVKLTAEDYEKKSRSKTQVKSNVKPAMKLGTKRPPSEAEEDDHEMGSRRSKKKKSEADDYELKERKALAVTPGSLWSPEHVIGLLESMIKYKKDKGLEPSANFAAFTTFLESRLQIKFPDTRRVSEKVRKLRRKFKKQMKTQTTGKDLKFKGPHDPQVFDLSREIWGDEFEDAMAANEVVLDKRNGKSHGKTNKIGKMVVKQNEKMNGVKEDFAGAMGEEVDLDSQYHFLSQLSVVDVGMSTLFAGSNNFLKQNMTLIRDEKARELECKWKDLRKAEARLLSQKLDLMKEQVESVIETLQERS